MQFLKGDTSFCFESCTSSCSWGLHFVIFIKYHLLKSWEESQNINSLVTSDFVGPVLCTFCLQKFLRFHLKLGFVLHFVLLFDNLSYKCPTFRAIYVLLVLLFGMKLSYFPTYWTLKVGGRYAYHYLFFCIGNYLKRTTGAK